MTTSRPTPSLWRDVKDVILQGSPEPHPILECSLCQNLNDIIIPGLYAHTDRTTEEAHGVVILPCGHMFGDECWTEFLKASFKNSAGHPYLAKLDLGIDINKPFDFNEAQQLSPQHCGG
ncbi:hypothetical protein B0T14DRAFT_571991 [Immersiella caudata]|uniref:RING-type domain-containing protein n=1 Tax=Immersiella caudata TaxID=314043 RepID=A0AA39T237_9PEZI|nr:hypothetical protein B0T14DRAFT_571991 [Immersiella caudata]